MLYSLLKTRPTEIELKEIREELSHITELVDEHYQTQEIPEIINQAGGVSIICIGLNNLENIYDYPLPGVDIVSTDYGKYWANEYWYLDETLKRKKSFLSFIIKEQGNYKTLMNIIEKSAGEIGNPLMNGTYPKTIYLSRVRGHHECYKHLDVTDEKLFIPILSNNECYFTWYKDLDRDTYDYTDKILVEEGKIFHVDVSLPHGSYNHGNRRWMVTVEKPFNKENKNG